MSGQYWKVDETCPVGKGGAHLDRLEVGEALDGALLGLVLRRDHVLPERDAPLRDDGGGDDDQDGVRGSLG